MAHVALSSDSLVKVIRHFFNEWKQDQHITRDELPNADLLKFVEWLGTKGSVLPSETIADQLDVEPQEVEYVLGLSENPAGANKLVGMWPYLTLEHRDLPSPALTSCRILALMVWDDGVVCPVSALLHKDMLNNQPITDAAIVAETVTKASVLANTIKNASVAKLHEQHSGGPAFGSPETVQLLRKVLNASTFQLSPAEAMRLVGMLEFLEMLFPADIRQKVKDANKQRPVAVTRQPKDSPGSGWAG